MSEGPSFELLVAAALLLPDLDTISVGKAKSELRTNPSGDTPWRLKNPQVRDALQAAREQLQRDREQLAFNNLIQLASPQAWHYMLEHFAPDPQAIDPVAEGQDALEPHQLLYQSAGPGCGVPQGAWRR